MEAANLDGVPTGMVGVTIPAGRYLEFAIRGQMPQALIETWQSIWKYFSGVSAYQRAYTADFELYKRNPETQQTEVSIYIAIA